MSEERISKTKAKKESFVNDVIKKIESFNSAVIINYKSLTVDDIFNLKKTLRKNGSIFSVYSNNVMRRAFEKKKVLFSDGLLKGMNGLVLLKDTMSGLKDLATFLKDKKKDEKTSFDIKTGLIDGNVLSREKIIELSNIPRKEENVVKLINIILNMPLASLSYILKNKK